ncbi:MAG: Metallo-beta-lactamase superfamily [Pseudomonadota bacterium]|jgi:glyoxylase-like metal-dependent hydrolase (beta-lactamase superfamily II)
MFLRASGLIYERLYLITLGATCRYAIVAESGDIALSDPGATVHVHALKERFDRLKLSFAKVRQIFVTHLDADRVAGIPLLRKLNPSVRVYGTAAMRTQLADRAFVRSLFEHDQQISKAFNIEPPSELLSFEEFSKGLKVDKHLVETDSIHLDEDITIRSVSTPGHRPHSVAYLVVPHEFAIVDETLGYFQGRSLAAPGGDTNLHETLASIRKFNNVQLNGIGFSYGGAVTGALTKRHLLAITQNTEDLIREVTRAREEGLTESALEEQVRAAFYTANSNDYCHTESLESTFKAVMRQLLKATS